MNIACAYKIEITYAFRYRCTQCTKNNDKYVVFCNVQYTNALQDMHHAFFLYLQLCTARIIIWQVFFTFCILRKKIYIYLGISFIKLILHYFGIGR